MNAKNTHINPIYKYLILTSVLLTILSSSCAINKYIPEDKILLTKNQVKLKKSELTKKQLDRDRIRFVVPVPKYGLGKSYIYFYARHDDPDDTTSWDRFFRKLGEKPIWHTTSQAEETKNDLIKHLNASGYYQGKVSFDVKQKHKRAKVIYSVDPGVPLKLRSIQYNSENKEINAILDSLKPYLKLKQGSVMDEQVLIPDQAKIIQAIQDAGYYQVNKSNFDYYYEDSTNQTIDLLCTILPPAGKDEISRFKIEQINVYSSDRLSTGPGSADTTIDGISYKYGLENQILNPSILKNYIQFHKDSLYSLSELQRTRSTFQNLGVYKSVSIIPEVLDDQSLSMNLYLPPVKKQFIQVDIEGGYVTNKDQTAGNKLFDIRAPFQYRHRNTFRGAEQFTFSLIPNIGLQLVKGKLFIPYGINGGINFTIPRFLEIGFVKFAKNSRLISNKFYSDIKNGARTRISAGVIYDRFLYSNRLTGEAETSIQRETKLSLGYELTKDNRIFYRFNPIGFDYLNYDLSPGFNDIALPFLKKSFEDRLLASVFLKEITIDINNQYLNQNNSRILLSFESSGLETEVIDLFTKNAFLPKVSRFLRMEADGRYTWKLSGSSQLATRITTGIAIPFGSSNNIIPFVRQFYVGGPNSVRGWAIREIGPGRIKNEQTERYSFFQTGNFKLEFGSEYRFDIFRWFKGAFFFDGGNVWLLNKDPLLEGGELSSRFLSELYLSTGTGLRLDFNYFLIRIDAGIKLRTPYLQENGSHRPPSPLKFKNMQFNLSLGLPF